MSEPDWRRLYLARWPTGVVTLLSAHSLEHAADLLDQVDNANECEVVPFDGDLWLTMRPADEPAAGLFVLVQRATLEIDSQAEIVERAFPVLHRLIEQSHRTTEDGDTYDEPIPIEAWREAVEMERDRILAPSSEWKAAVAQWGASLAGPPRDEPDD